jgi:hypothetical protein
MKMMFACCCGTIVVPHHEDRVVRWCACQAAACWWEDIRRGQFALFSHGGEGAALGLALHNGLLAEPVGAAGYVQRDKIERLIAQSRFGVFKEAGSLVIKYRPGFAPDCRFVRDPGEIPGTREVARVEGRAR